MSNAFDLRAVYRREAPRARGQALAGGVGPISRYYP